ncbi:MAG: hypothetical protein KDA87_20155 [Planctomycetales bacterium]|nr:hypothetical protein [Planctomycetales bacterium]
MNRQRLVLVGLLGVIAVFYVGDLAYRSLYVQPLEAEQRKTKPLKDKLLDSKLAVREEERLLESLPQLQQRSLPSDLELAIADYRNWLLEVIESAGLARTSVNAGQPMNHQNLVRSISFSIRGTGTLEQLTSFLHAFYETGYLHRIRSITLNPTSSGKVDASISIEALSLPTAESTDSLPTPQPGALAFDDVDAYRSIGRRNLFSSGGGDKVLQSIRLTAITKDANGQLEVWLSPPSGPSLIAQQGDELTVAGRSFVVYAVDANAASIDIGGEVISVPLGETIQHAKP